ncbi:glucosyl-3-phosphoglycerate synthase [Corynebacterium ulcerans]|uniref:Glucosyl-3-phosphoglycerate synthase n=1 Tax=Corynebacterium ulcerans TaxID=65058 RepID=A0ABD0BFY3_CORUL|nr:glucosyl-3-phosphoglycerate synthase [Corynebacterium ulcerans]AEG83556.1 hypothetical protein CULC22_00843 [Corynebacterium ulcerans BR-AD22]AIT88825.1 Glycosyl transferase group 2 [Corynebacterium ulcerans]ALD94601.1 Glycosyl transferase group 2 [Corynebacterium ulcerans]KPH76859.1 glucosyl-3-phosphoglycerate synthase [Corynebacterium ulcerans]MBH5301919.1 glucosyl-3-phosphoglycerate synthase [Corynebacterium ulcerans]
MKISVVIPALNEEATVGDVVRVAAAAQPWEILVIDSDSTDATAVEARRAGARVLNWKEPVALPPRVGKGEALWRGVAAATGDVIVFLDADLTEIAPTIVTDLSAPLRDPDIHLVKAAYQRAFASSPSGGGRVTELTAKPLLRAVFPELTRITQPLGGEYAIRADTARSLPFVDGYGVEVGLLIDVARLHGSAAITEVNVGRRAHRNRPLEELAPMADVVAETILSRAGVVKPRVGERPALKSLS